MKAVRPSARVTIIFTLAASLLSALCWDAGPSSAQQNSFAGDYDRANFAPPNGYAIDPRDPDPATAGEEQTYFVGGERLADGSVVAGGRLYDGGQGDFWLRKYTPSGAVDTSFGANGSVRANFFMGPSGRLSNEIPNALRVQPDGKILIAGICDVGRPDNVGAGFGYGFCLMRFNASGSVDTAFGNNTVFTGGGGGNTVYSFQVGQGRVLTETKFDENGVRGGHPEGRVWVGDMAIQPDGKIVVAGETTDYVNPGPSERRVGVIVRYNADGSLDTGFGSNGLAKFVGVKTSVDPNAACWTPRGFRGVALQTDGRIVAVGYDGSTDTNCFAGKHFVVTRWTAAGQLEAVRRLDNDASVSAREIAYAALLSSGGNKIFVSGAYQKNAIVRLNLSDLSPDTSFGTGGVRQYGNPVNGEVGTPLLIKAIQPDGKILGIYRYFSDGTGVVRFNPDGSADSSFGNRNAFDTEQSGELTLTADFPQCGTHTFGANHLILRPDGKLNLFGAIGCSQFTGPLAVVSQNVNAVGSALQFSVGSVSVPEDAGSITLTVTRTGDTSGAVSVDYATSDGTASERSDYTAALGTLSFAPGEASKNISVLVTDDALVEGNETFNVALSNPVGSAVLSGNTSVTVTIIDNDSAPAPNPIDGSQFFVREHYHDFLNREPDAAGLQFWTNEVEKCGSDVQCREVKRINASAAFFLSIEFQETGYLVERFYKTAFGDGSGMSSLGDAQGASHNISVPVVRLKEFLGDTQRIGQGVVVNQGDWQTQLENNKQAFASEFVRRARFQSAYPTTQTPAQFVDALFQHAGVAPSDSDRNATVAEFGGAADTSDQAARSRALRRVAENASLKANENNRAFVLMQYFGYLRRNPNDAPDSDYTGYDFWLHKLDQFGGNFVQAEMVKAFILSTEYRRRFGQP